MEPTLPTARLPARPAQRITALWSLMPGMDVMIRYIRELSQKGYPLTISEVQ